MARNERSELDHARDELMSHIHRCGVLRSTPEQQGEWMDDTVGYLGECYPSLSRDQLAELRTIGMRFCQPVIHRGIQGTPAPQPENADGELAEV